MKTKIKKIAYGIGASILLLPGLALADVTDTTVAGGGGFVIPDPGLPKGTLTQIMTQAMNFLLYAVGIIAVISFAISGILYLTAAGDEDRIKTAKKAMVMSIVGVVVALLGVVILQAVKGLLGGQNSNY
jgi:Fe2+ transport system protein B